MVASIHLIFCQNQLLTFLNSYSYLPSIDIEGDDSENVICTNIIIINIDILPCLYQLPLLISSTAVLVVLFAPRPW